MDTPFLAIESKARRSTWREHTARSLLLTVLLLWNSAPAAAQSLLERRAGVVIDDQPIEVALLTLQRTAGVQLAFSPDLLPEQRRVSCACYDATVRAALDAILTGSGLTYRSGARQIRIVPVASSTPVPQTGVIMGKVLGLEGNTPIPGVVVELDGGQRVRTNSFGAFWMAGVSTGSYRLSATGFGWEPLVRDDVVVTAPDTLALTLRMTPAVIPLEAIVVAPGSFEMLEETSPGSIRALTREEMQTLPQLGEDVLRGLKRLPGVASHDISTKLNIRGARDRETLVRLDGLELIEPYHLKDWDGALSIVDLNALGGMELMTGGFGAEHGNRMAGILDMRSMNAEGPSKTTLGLSVSSVTGMSHGSFAGGSGSWLVSARRGFMDLVLRMIGEDERLAPEYYDFFGKVSIRPTPTSQLRVDFLHAGDRLVLRATDEPDEVDLTTGWDSTYGWLTWEASLTPRVSATSMLWGGRVARRRDGFSLDPNRVGMPDRISVLDHRVVTFDGFRQELGFDVSERARVTLGGEVRRANADYEYEGRTNTAVLDPEGSVVLRPDSLRVNVEPEGHEVRGWVSARLRPLRRLTTEVGLRYDRVTHTDDSSVSPRFLTVLELDPDTRLRGSWGRYTQSQGMHELEVGDGQTVFNSWERTDMAALGLEHRLASGTNLRFELYRKWIANPSPIYLNLEQELEIFPEREGDRSRIDPTAARASGLEVSLEKKEGGRWAWSASYALALAEDRVGKARSVACVGDPDCGRGRWVPRLFDQRHTVILHATYKPSPKWNLSWGFRYHSGWPATAWTFQATRLDDGSVFWTRSFGPLRATRLPAYHRLDFRVTRDMTVFGNSLHVYLDLFNAFNRTNIASYYYAGTFENEVVSTRRSGGQELLPLLPTIGFRYRF